jgi:REP element-mobilizing transposase RayT
MKDTETKKLRHPIITLVKAQQAIVLETIKKHCKLKDWKLYAVHVRSNHIHLIVEAREKPEKIMSGLKAWATRMLRRKGYEIQKVWTRNGSTKYIFSHEKLNEKIKYVIDGQGEKMEYYCIDYQNDPGTCA